MGWGLFCFCLFFFYIIFSGFVIRKIWCIEVRLRERGVKSGGGGGVRRGALLIMHGDC